MSNLKQRQGARQAVDFANIPDVVLRQPPIRHKGSDDATLLTPLQFRVLVVVLGLARVKLRKVDDHEEAYASGRQNVERERQRQNAYIEEVKSLIPGRKKLLWAKKNQPDLEVKYVSFPNPPAKDSWGKTIKPKQAIRNAGRMGYRDSRYALKRQPLDAMHLTTTHAQIFKHARMDKHGCRQAIEEALERPRQPISKFPPLLLDYHQPGPQLDLVINGWWLPVKHYDPIPYQLPTGATALALFLYLRSLSFRLEHGGFAIRV
jgi:hypothetical protein